MPIPSNSEKAHLYREILNQIETELKDYNSKSYLYQAVIDKLSTLPHFNWTGIYEYDGRREMLDLHPHFIGLPTEHVHIPKGKGVCGTAVATNQDIIVEDVRQLDNYLACSSGTKSEIVVLIKDETRIYGQIDVDSDEVGAFNECDRKGLEKISQFISQTMKQLRID